MVILIGMNTVKIRAYADTAEKIKQLARDKKGWSTADEVDALYKCAMMIKHQYTYQRVIEKISSGALNVGAE